VEEWRRQGIEVRVVRCDVADPASVHALFKSLAEDLPPVRGVFHSAMVLHDQLLAKAGRDAFAQVFAPKALGAWNLHREPATLARYVENVGLTGLSRDTVFAWLKFLLRRDVESAFVLQADWLRFGEASPTARSSDRFAALITPTPSDTEGELPRHIAAAAPAERLALVSAHLRRMIAAVLGADGATI